MTYGSLNNNDMDCDSLYGDDFRDRANSADMLLSHAQYSVNASLNSMSTTTAQDGQKKGLESNLMSSEERAEKIRQLMNELHEAYTLLEQDEAKLDACWTDPNSWSFGYAVYSCSSDPRLMVYKRHGSYSGYQANLARNNTAANQLKSEWALHRSRKDNLKKVLKTEFGVDVDAVPSLPISLPACYERLLAVETEIAQFQRHLDCMWADPKHWFGKNKDYYSCYNDYRQQVPARDAKASTLNCPVQVGNNTLTGKPLALQNNWNANKTLYAQRFGRQHQKLLNEKAALQKKVARMEKFLASH